jgi:hypothetical protein
MLSSTRPSHSKNACSQAGVWAGSGCLEYPSLPLARVGGRGAGRLGHRVDDRAQPRGDRRQVRLGLLQRVAQPAVIHRDRRVAGQPHAAGGYEPLGRILQP